MHTQPLFQGTIVGLVVREHNLQPRVVRGLQPAATFTSGDAGVHFFTATFTTVGTRTLTARDKVTTTIFGTDTGIQVTL